MGESVVAGSKPACLPVMAKTPEGQGKRTGLEPARTKMLYKGRRQLIILSILVIFSIFLCLIFSIIKSKNE
jgi:hypothetical protein